ncbi:hypothetical protein [Paraflavitalea sp. CAU 1676]|uniref:hypothetical protein n=1 Tax=Paraflavitalea sp. CAU 1676 TaxID=3032598 RepID=UPI0023D9F3DA|nr:hypothetical protein [Paraflavitalea sp. CAU 1676]MDF2190555.1 hypothetical protein [Paraflavitalea sp. CAU 1676]
MSQIFRFFLVVEGVDTGFPNYSDAIIHFADEDPSSLQLANSFISSPLFSVKQDGVSARPELEDGTLITFLMVPKIFPILEELVSSLQLDNEIWFSLGLANVVIIERPAKREVSKQIIEKLKQEANITASETWRIKDNKILKHKFPYSQLDHHTSVADQISITVSDKLPLHLKFTVSEFILSANKFLSASKKFTPRYYEKHCKTVDASLALINDLSFLYGDLDFVPENFHLKSIYDSYNEKSDDVLRDNTFLKIREELINDYNGRLIQFNSALSYVYSQTYSGTFPLFDHFGIIQRHSLLGVGSAISSLTELLVQLESAFYFLPFESIDDCLYGSSMLSDLNILNSFMSLSGHDVEIWKKDSVRNSVLKESNPLRTLKSLPSDFFIRLAFFSGRLGFREYDFSATAALQVLVEANSLQWNVINYTHEIIHNHVRLILNNLLLPLHNSKNGDYEKWLEQYLQKLADVFQSINKRGLPSNTTYKDFFIFVLFRYCVNHSYYGSLSYPSNQKEINELKTDTSRKKKYNLPSAPQLKEIILNHYKDITEIFVHVIDYSYIYSRQVEVYLQSIWASWSTVTTVATDLRQYILRTLIITALNETGTLPERFNKARKKFLLVLDKIADQNQNAYLFKRIREALEDDKDEDLKTRFYNCIVVGDMVYNFFVGELELYLDNSDKNRLPKGDYSKSGVLYDIERNSFQGNEIKSKVRFALDQLIRETNDSTRLFGDSKKERTSAWLLISLSSSS